MNEDIDDIIKESVFKNIRKLGKKIPVNTNGVYIINVDSGDRYIGSSINIPIEIDATIYRFKPYYKIDNITAYKCKDENQARNLERFLIGKINPKLNYLYRTDGKEDGKKIKVINLRTDTHTRLKAIQTLLKKRSKIKMSIKDILEYLIPSSDIGFEEILDKIELR